MFSNIDVSGISFMTRDVNKHDLELSVLNCIKIRQVNKIFNVKVFHTEILVKEESIKYSIYNY